MLGWIRKIASAVAEFYRPCSDCERGGGLCAYCRDAIIR